MTKPCARRVLQQCRAALIAIMIATLLATSAAAGRKGFGFGFSHGRAHGAVAAPTIVTAPTLSGDPVVGQIIYATNGTYSSAPDSIRPTWTVGGVALSDQLDGSLLVLDSYAGSAIGYSEVAHKVGFSDSAANAATSTASVTDISLTNAITALSRTSASATVPMTWNLSLGANVYEGYFLRAEVYSDSALTSRVQNVSHSLTNADLQSGANIKAALTADGLTDPSATQWLSLTVFTTSPNGFGYSFNFPTPISPTDAVVAMTWSPTDKTSGVTLSGGNLVATQGGGGGAIRTSRAVGYDLTYIEIVGGQHIIAVADTSANLADQWGSAIDGLVATTHAGSYTLIDGGQITYNGSPRGDVGAWISTDTVQIALDRVNKKVWFGVNNVWKNGTPGVSGGLDCTGIGTPLYFAMQAANGAAATLNAGTTPGGTAGFTYTPPTGFVAP